MTGTRSAGDALGDLAACMATLRAECPWDRVQTHASLRRHLLEETHEALEALDALGDPDRPAAELDARFADLREELGDVLFQVVFHAHLAAESGRFTLAEVIDGVRDKLMRRHPDIFAPDTGDGPDPGRGGDPLAWERAKVAEKDRDSVMDGIPASLPALVYAAKVIGKARVVDPDLVATPASTTGVSDAADLGARLLGLVADARAAGLDAESVLRETTRRLERQVRRIEAANAGSPPA